MKTILTKMTLLICTVVVVSCASNPSLQKYYIDNSDNENFVTLDIPANVFSLKDSAPKELTQALATIDKFNILAFVMKDGNDAAYAAENLKVKAIMKNTKYQELIRVKHKGSNILLKYEGGENDETLDEVVLYASDKKMGFALVRILGDNMNPADMMQFAKHLDAFNFEGTELEGILQNVGKRVVSQM